MSDELAIFFESRDTRVGRLPDSVRVGFESMKASPEELDKQFSSLWLSRRLGVPRRTVAQNFDVLAGKVWGEGTTPSQAYDKIASYYNPPMPEAEMTGGEPKEETAINTSGMAKMPKDNWFTLQQSGKALGAGWQRASLRIPEGVLSQLGSFYDRPTPKNPMANEEYAKLFNTNEAIRDPGQFSQVYDEPISFGPTLGPEEEANIAKNEARMAEIRRDLDSQYAAEVEQWTKTDNPRLAEGYRNAAKFFTELVNTQDKRWELDPRFRKTTLGMAMDTIGGAPVYAVTAMLSPAKIPVGAVGVESAMFAEEEAQRRETEGAGYDPNVAAPQLAASAIGQAVLERAFGLERVLGRALRESAKVGGKVRFGELAKNFGRAALVSGAEEGITEPAQGALSDWLASLSYDEKREVFSGEGAKRRIVESLAGFALGSIMGGTISTIAEVDAARTSEQLLTTSDGRMLSPDEFRALRSTMTDQELVAQTGDAESSRLLIAAVNGDEQAMAEYNSVVKKARFVNTDGATADGMTIADMDGVPVVTNQDGSVVALDMADPEQRTFLQQWQDRVAEQSAFEKAVAEGEVVEHVPGYIESSIVGKWADKVIAERAAALNTADPQLVLAYAVKGAEIIENGVRDFASWSEKMIKQHGEEIATKLKRIFKESNKIIAERQAETELQARFDRIRAKRVAVRAELESRIEQNMPLPERVKRSSQKAAVTHLSYIKDPITTRLGEVDPALSGMMKKMEKSLRKNIAQDLDILSRFFKKAKRLNKQDSARLHLALLNGDREVIERIVKDNGMEAEFTKAENTLADIRERAIETGLEVGFRENYWPRHVFDLSGFRAAIQATQLSGVIDLALKEAKSRVNRELTHEEKEAVVNSALQGYRPRIARAPGNAKERAVEVVTLEMMPFYQDFVGASVRYVERMNESIEMRKFFGKHLVKDNGVDTEAGTTQVDVEKSIGSLVNSLMESGKVTDAQQENVKRALTARFAYRKTGETIGNVRALGHFAAMGQFLSTVTQLSDWQFPLFESGLLDTLVGTAQAISGKSTVKRADLGLDAIGEEYKDPSKLAKLVNFTFKATGMHYVVAAGQQTLINASLRRAMREARAGKLSERYSKRLAMMHPDPAAYAQAMLDLREGRNTEELELWAWFVLTDFNPIALSEMPEAYLNHPVGRIAYSLKTFDMKRFDVYKRESFDLIRNGNASEKKRGAKNLFTLMLIFLTAGATTDWIKNWMLGNERTLPDAVWANVWKLFGLNSYALTKNQSKDDSLAEKTAKAVAAAPQAAAEWLLPPLSFATMPTKDLATISDKVDKGEDLSWKDFESVGLIPLGGRIVSSRWGAASKRRNKRRKSRVRSVLSY